MTLPGRRPTEVEVSLADAHRVRKPASTLQKVIREIGKARHVTKFSFSNFLQRRRETARLKKEIGHWLEEGVQPPPSNSSSTFSLLLVGHETSLTGAPKVLLELGREIKRSYDVRLFFAFLQGGALLPAYQELAPCLDLSKFALRNQRKINCVALSFARLPAPKGAILNTVLTADFVRPLARRKIPAWSWIHDSARCIEENDRGGLLMSELQRHAQKIIYSSPANLAEGQRKFHLDESKTAAIRYGTRPRNGAPDQEAIHQLRHTVGCKAEGALVLGCGTVQVRKGTDLFVEAALFALRNCPAGIFLPQFLWIGRDADAAFAAKIRSMIAADPLGSNIHLLGESSAVEPYFAACDLFLLPSRDDPYPLVTLEAMSRARPVLAFTHATGQEELFAHFPPSLLPAGDAEAMGKKILEFMRHPQPFVDAGLRAQANVHELLCWEKSALSFSSLLGLTLRKCHTPS